MASLERDIFSELDLSSYQAIYVSYGSTRRFYEGNPRLFFQDAPSFLEFLKVPTICIAIDVDFKFHIETRHFNLEDTPYTFVTIPTRDMDDTISITDKLVKLLELNTIKTNVYFVNFIKFRNPNPKEERILAKSMELKAHIPYAYYDWCGFILPHFIMKIPSHDTPIRKNVENYLNIVYQTRNEKFLNSLKDDSLLTTYIAEKHTTLDKTQQKKLYHAIRSSLFDIGFDLTSDQYNITEPNVPTKGGKRKRKTKRKILH